MSDHVVVDADLANSRARFRDHDPAGNRVPGAVEGVVSSGVSVYDLGRWGGSIRYCYLGPRPLIEDNTVRSRTSHMLNAELGFKASPRVRFVFETLNLTDARVSDIDDFYSSRLRHTDRDHLLSAFIRPEASRRTGPS